MGAGVLRLGLVLLAAALLASCVNTVAARRFPALDERRTAIQRVAVAPLVAPEDAATSAPVVARYLTEALVARGIEVVGPEDVARAAGATGADDVPELAALVNREFGADALVLGEITRWIEREGNAAGTRRPASVGLRVSLYSAGQGERLWVGSFDHTQQPLSENVLLTTRYPGGGTRWLTAEEFAQFAAQELAAALPLAP